METTPTAGLRWQWIVGPGIGMAVALYLQGIIQGPAAWAIGGLIWGAVFSPGLVGLTPIRKGVIVVYHGSLMGFLNWLMAA